MSQMYNISKINCIYIMQDAQWFYELFKIIKGWFCFDLFNEVTATLTRMNKGNKWICFEC